MRKRNFGLPILLTLIAPLFLWADQGSNKASGETQCPQWIETRGRVAPGERTRPAPGTSLRLPTLLAPSDQDCWPTCAYHSYGQAMNYVNLARGGAETVSIRYLEAAAVVQKAGKAVWRKEMAPEDIVVSSGGRGTLGAQPDRSVVKADSIARAFGLRPADSFHLTDHQLTILTARLADVIREWRALDPIVSRLPPLDWRQVQSAVTKKILDIASEYGIHRGARFEFGNRTMTAEEYAKKVTSDVEWQYIYLNHSSFSPPDGEIKTRTVRGYDDVLSAYDFDYPWNTPQPKVESDDALLAIIEDCVRRGLPLLMDVQSSEDFVAQARSGFITYSAADDKLDPYRGHGFVVVGIDYTDADPLLVLQNSWGQLPKDGIVRMPLSSARYGISSLRLPLLYSGSR